jgi:hypothetical protein
MSDTPQPAAPSPEPSGPPQYVLASPQVVLEGVCQPLLAFIAYLAIWHSITFSSPLVITSGKDAVHSASSLHGIGKAVDVRIKDLDAAAQMIFLLVLAYCAPDNHIAVFDERALDGQEHIHLEYHGA